MAHTKNLRSATVNERTSYQLINVDQTDDKRSSKDSCNNVSKISKSKQGNVIDGSSRARNERNSGGYNENTRSHMKGNDNHSNIDGVAETVKYSRKSKYGNKPSTGIPETNQKIPIEQFYAQKGMDYRTVRKNCRMRVNGEDTGRSGGTNLHVDFYQPPEGYTVDDLPDSQGQGILSQHLENPISPAVLIAAQPKKDRVKIVSLTPDTDPEEMIRRIQMGRRKKEMGGGGSNTSSNVAKEATKTITYLNDTFPDNSLNDSDLIIASQQVENEHIDHPGRLTKDVFKRDINGNSKTPPVPLTSTPVPDLIKNPTYLTAEQTPKTTRGLSRSRNRSGHGKANHTSIFENSFSDNNTDNDQSKLDAEGDGQTAPRKLLKFDESPIKKVNIIIQNEEDIGDDDNENRSKSGEFNDDSEDEIFSQIQIPGDMGIRKPCVFESSSESISSAPITQLVTSKSNSDNDCAEMDMDSYLDEEALDTIAKLEAIHCTSGSSTRSSAPKVEYNPKPQPELKVKGKSIKTSTVNKAELTKETPRTRARRQGLSRRTLAH